MADFRVLLGNSEWSLPMTSEGWKVDIAPGMGLRLSWRNAFEGYRILELEILPTTAVDLKPNFKHFFAQIAENLRWIVVKGLSLPQGANSFLANGYQCWSESSFVDKNSTLRRESHEPQKYFGDDQIWNYRERLGTGHAWSFTILEGNQRNFLMACLTEDRSFGLFELDLVAESVDLYLDYEGFDFLSMAEDFEREKRLLLGAWLLPDADFKISKPIFEVAREWFKYIKRYETTSRIKKSPTETASPVLGYTSWYNKFTEIDEPWLLDHIENVSRLTNWNVFQVDDGYQLKIGDWLSPSKGFPEGIQGVIARAKGQGLIPGLWLAPFVALFDSKLAVDHPEWIVTKNGEPVVAGDFAHWGGKFYVMDTENESYREYIANVVNQFKNWGVKFIKADFLYAAAMNPRNGKTRAEISARAHQWFYQLCVDHDIKFLSCGAPLSSAYGRCDFARIGPDISLDWEFKPLKGTFSREKPSVRGSMINTITRALFNDVCFLNDPDVVILRSENNSLNFKEKRNLTSINRAFGGLLFSSDSPELYGSQENQLLMAMEKGISMEQIEHFNVISAQPFHAHIHTRRGVWKVLLDDSSEVEFVPH